jgi:DNA-directed RNA polymerase subunit RPC12/RpoP
MRIDTPSSPEIAVKERIESDCPSRCPMCSALLVPLHNSYRCSRCSYHFCLGCEPFDRDPPSEA